MSKTSIRNLRGVELEDFKSTFKITGYFPPTTYTSHLDGQKYALSIGVPWIPIPHAMTQQDVHERWIKKELRKPTIEKKVISSRGKTEYTVTFDKGWKCTCSGFRFKRNCIHITEVKSTIKTKLCTV